jgi:hypothetical protein
MHNPRLVRRHQRGRYLRGDVERLVHLQVAGARQQRAQRLAVNELRGDEVMAVGFSDFVNGQDVGVIEGGRRLRFLFEPK